MAEKDDAEALVNVLSQSTWLGVVLAKAYLALTEGADEETVARQLYSSGSFTLRKARELTPKIKADGFGSLIPIRERTGSSENPITKLFPAAVTEQIFLSNVDSLRDSKPTIDYEDQRFAGHTLVDFNLKEGQIDLPINVKNAGTRFENAQQLVGIDPNDCIPIPAYKAYDAIEKVPNLLYAISVDYSLIETIKTSLLSLFEAEESIVWKFLILAQAPG